MKKIKLLLALVFLLMGSISASASITIYVNSSSSSYYMYAWNDDGDLTASWPGTQLSTLSTTTIDGTTYYYMTFDVSSVSVIFNEGSDVSKTGDIGGITSDAYFTYSGGTTYENVTSSITGSTDDDDDSSTFTANVYVSAEYAEYNYIHAYYLDSSGNGMNLTGNWKTTLINTGTATTIDGDTYYLFSFTVTSGYTLCVMFVDGYDAQTDAYSITTSGDYYIAYNGGTTYSEVTISSSGSGDSDDSGDTDDSSTIIANIYVSSEYATSYYIYAWSIDSSGNKIADLSDAWGTSSSGTLISSGEETDVDGVTYYLFTYTAECASIGVIFNNGSGGDTNQTEDIIITSSGDYYYTYSGGSSYSAINTYYLVSNELTGGERLEDFKFTPDRTRDGGDLNYNFQNLNLQNFVIELGNGWNDDEYLEFWIEDQNGTKYYSTASNQNYLEDTSTTVEGDMNGPIIDTNFDNDLGRVKYYYIPWSSSGSNTFKLKKDLGVSYTWLWHPGNSCVRLLVNVDSEFGDTYEGEHGYYLIGNFSDATAETDIDPVASVYNRTLLTPYYYKNGNAYGGTYEDCDSIVYKTEIARPSHGWGNLYMDVVSESDYETYSTATWVGNTSAWATAIRPEAPWYADDGTMTAMDCAALHGGLYRNNNSATQSINPYLEGENPDSYVFSMNVTTSSYSIQFVSLPTNDTTDDDDAEDTTSGFYIMGTAVASSNSGVTTSDNWDSAYALKLSYNSDSGYYYLDDGTGGEDAISMVANGKFAFVTNMDFSNYFYAENASVPVNLVDDESTAYSAELKNGNYDTQYVNVISDASYTSSSSYNETSVNPITWGLPTGDYYIRFYVSTINGEQRSNLYTVQRTYKMLRPWSDGVVADDSETYTTFKVFSDYNAVMIPDDVQVFYVSEITEALEEGETSGTYELEAPKIYEFTGNDDRVLPANTTVILAKTTEYTNSSKTLETEEITMDYYSNPVITWDDISSQEQIATQMLPSIPYELAPDAKGDDVTNFVFGYKTLNGEDESADETKVTIGFYLPIANSYSAINGGYLPIPNDYLGSSASENANTLALIFSSGSDDESGEATAITTVETTDGETSDGAYYTIQGIRVSYPTTKGVYIHNGKKIIVR